MLLNSNYFLVAIGIFLFVYFLHVCLEVCFVKCLNNFSPFLSFSYIFFFLPSVFYCVHLHTHIHTYTYIYIYIYIYMCVFVLVKCLYKQSYFFPFKVLCDPSSPSSFLFNVFF